MKKILATAFLALTFYASNAQEINFVEYDLDNGLHVILHQDNRAPVITTAISYHVGSKDEEEGRSGFAHFFEHLLFEGTENIEGGQWFKIVEANGGSNNAYTTDDQTYYYEVFPSNKLELSLWMESERMLHPIIRQEDRITLQEGVVKEEKNFRLRNAPYGALLYAVRSNLYKKHPYGRLTIGLDKDLTAADINDFKKFNARYHKPNNATLVVAGDIDVNQTKEMVEKYFADIPSSDDVVRNLPKEDPIEETIRSTWYDPNIQVPALLVGYITPKMNTREARVLSILSTYLSDGKSSVLYKRMVDDNKLALAVQTVNLAQEDYGTYLMLALPLGEITLEKLLSEIDEEIEKVKNELITDRDLEKLQNTLETQFVNRNASIEGIANSLSDYYTFYGDTGLINSELDIYRSITKEEIRDVAKKYLNSNQRVIVDYLPGDETNKTIIE
jgi:zinc protease